MQSVLQVKDHLWYAGLKNGDFSAGIAFLYKKALGGGIQAILSADGRFKGGGP